MINVYTNRENYQYDLYALIKSFYPEHDVRVYGEEQRSSKQDSGDQIIVQLSDNSMKVLIDIDCKKEYEHTYKNNTDAIKKRV